MNLVADGAYGDVTEPGRPLVPHDGPVAVRCPASPRSGRISLQGFTLSSTSASSPQRLTTRCAARMLRSAGVRRFNFLTT